MGVEDVSILAAIRVVDEQVWDGQERSTRYQPFKKTGYFTPQEIQGTPRENYEAAADAMFIPSFWILILMGHLSDASRSAPSKS